MHERLSSLGIFSNSNRPCSAPQRKRVTHNHARDRTEESEGPIRRRKRKIILTTDQSHAGTASPESGPCFGTSRRSGDTHGSGAARAYLHDLARILAHRSQVHPRLAQLRRTSAGTPQHTFRGGPQGVKRGFIDQV
eukprot:435295-Prorocentrum_minimum.AAC.1